MDHNWLFLLGFFRGAVSGKKIFTRGMAKYNDMKHGHKQRYYDNYEKQRRNFIFFFGQNLNVSRRAFIRGVCYHQKAVLAVDGGIVYRPYFQVGPGGGGGGRGESDSDAGEIVNKKLKKIQNDRVSERRQRTLAALARRRIFTHPLLPFMPKTLLPRLAEQEK